MSAGAAGAPPTSTDLSDERSRRARSGWSRSMIICVGMPPRCSRRSRSITSSTAAGSKASCTIDVPRWAIWIAIRDIVPMCAKERPAARCFGEDGAPPAWRRPSISARARRFRWLYQAPFGMPVVPLVKTIATGSSGAGGTADVGRAPPARSATVFAVPTRSRSAESQTTSASPGSSARSPSTVLRKSASCHSSTASRQRAPRRAGGRGRWRRARSVEPLPFPSVPLLDTQERVHLPEAEHPICDAGSDPVLSERPVNVAERGRRGEQAGERDGHDLEARRVEVRGGPEGSLPVLDHVGDEGHLRRERGPDRRHLLERLRRLDEDRIGAGLREGTRPADGLVQSERGAGVGAGGHVEERAPPEVEGGAELRQVLLELDDALPCHVTAALRPHLVLQEGAGGADADELVDRPLDVERVPVAGVDVDDERALDGGDDSPGGVRHLRLRQEPEIGLAEPRRREAVAGEEDRREAGELREQGTQRIVHAGEDERLARPEEVRDRIHDRPCHDSRALQKERVPGQEGGARAMAARLPHEFTAIDPAVRREIVDLEPADGRPGGAGVLCRPPRPAADVPRLARP